MRAFSYAWSLPVTWQRWRSHHSIRLNRKPHAARRLHGAMFCRIGLIADGSFILRKYKFWTFLVLWFWPWPDDLYMRTRSVCLRDMPYLRKWTSYVKAFESYRIIGIQTDRYTYALYKLYTTPLRGWSSICPTLTPKWPEKPSLCKNCLRASRQ